MAVQAQYRSSNVLLLNRNAQEGKNTTSGGGGAASALFDHQQLMPFNSGVGNHNTRKRSRELISPMDSSGALMALHQSQTSNQIIDLSQLHTHQTHPNNVVSTGLRLAFGEQLQHQTQQQQLSLLPSQSSQISPFFSNFLSEDLASHIKQQREEIDNFITFQGEQLRRASADKRQRSFRALLSAAEKSVARRLREKEAEVEKAFRLNAELEARAAQLTAESQAWQARAREQEVTAAALQAQIQQAMVSGGGAVMSIGGGGCSIERDGNCNGREGEAAMAEDAESVYIDPYRVTVLNGPSCKECGNRVASMVLLPCRHLCLCTECDTVARCCPLCYTFRSSSVEVIMG